VLHAGIALAGRHRLVEQILAGDIAEQLAIADAEALDARGRQQHLADGYQHDLVALAGGELAHRVERADGLQHVAEQVEAQRLVGARREEIDQAAAHRVLARLHHRVGAAVAVLAEVPGERGHVDGLALAQDLGGLGVELARRHLLQCRADRGENDARRRTRLLGRRQPHHGLQALGDDVGMRRQPVVRQAVPCREHQHLALGREEAQAVLQSLQPLAVARDVQDVLSAGRPGELGQHNRVGAFRQPGEGPAPGLALQAGEAVGPVFLGACH
jgi:hypothetical protein